MKTHTIKTPTAELLVVELAEGLSQMRKNTLWVMQHEGWEILGKPDEIREEDASKIVQKIEYDFGTCYRHYTDKTISAKTAKESLLSLLESEIYWDVNPLGNRNPANDPDFPYLDDAQQVIIDEWHEAEQKTFDRNRALIFVKN